MGAKTSFRPCATTIPVKKGWRQTFTRNLSGLKATSKTGRSYGGRVEDGCRRKLISRFPYGIIYRLLDDETWQVVAVNNLHQEPGQWRKRMK
ncbi:MAG: plasmid stabilization system protein ParE [Akkermansiaceae bacterium]|jgi:plasmid stabilization system protein ParE